MASAVLERAKAELTDEQVVERVLAGETELFEILMRRHNQRVYRAARSIVRDEHEAEDVMQEAYVRAYQHLGQFAGRAKFSTWLTRIAVHEALSRLERSRRFQELEPENETKGQIMNAAENPEYHCASSETGRLLEQAIDALPDTYRMVFVLRDVEELSTEEAGQVLGITQENVKTRLHRARALLRRELYARVGATGTSAFPFHAVRCDRVVNNVMERIAAL